MSFYQSTIQTILSQRGLSGRYDPRHIEAWMRVEHSTLDHLSLIQFADEVELCCQCIDQAGIDHAEKLAQSYGLGRAAA